MSNTIEPGNYTVRELLSKADFDFEKKAAADYLNGQPDFRRVQIGGLPFADLDEVIHVPYNATEVVVSFDDKKHTTLKVDNKAPQEE